MLNDIIDEFVSQFSNVAKQRSEEWYTLVKNTIGGSDMGTLKGVNPYRSVQSLIKDRVSESKFNGNLACWWGTIFEDVIARMIEIDLMTKVKGAEITIVNENLPGIRFSPDGYCVIRLHESQLVRQDKPCPKTCVKCQDYIALVEIKCPMRRKPGDTIPSYYISQLHSGLCFSTIAHIGLFVEAVIRKRSLQEIANEPSVAVGIVIFYDCQDDDCEDDSLLDLGVESFATVERYFRECVEEKKIGYVCSDPYFDVVDPSALLKESLDLVPANGRPLAFLPWICEEYHYKFVDREPLFLVETVSEVNKFYRTIEEVRETGPSHKLHPKFVRKKKTVVDKDQEYYADIDLPS